jgi:ferrous iron transport protein B
MADGAPRTLNLLKPGQRAIVANVRGEGSALHQRLMEMGVFAGAEIKVIRFAPLGDPMEVSVQGYNLSVRKAEAAFVDVTEVPSAEC